MRMSLLATGLAMVFTSVLPISADAQSTWAQVFSHWGYAVRFGRATATADGGCIVVGLSAAFGGNWYDGWVGKLDVSGKWQWQKSLGGKGSDGFTEVIQTHDGGYLVAGYRTWDYFYGGESWCVRMDSAGRKLWERTFAKVDIQRAQESVDGGFLLAGGDYPNSGCKLLKLDSMGNIVLNRTYGPPDMLADVPAIRGTPDGGAAIMTGNSVILRLGRTGDPEWSKQYPITLYAGDLAITDDGGYLVVGRHEDRVAVLRLDASGDAVWAETLSIPSYYDYSSCYQDRDGTLVIAAVGQGAYLARLDPSGQVLWAKRYRMSGDKRDLTVSPSTDGAILIAASRRAYDFHLLVYSNGFALRTAWDGTIDACKGFVKPLELSVEPFEVKAETLSPQASEPDVVMSSPVSRVFPATIKAYDVCAYFGEEGEK